MLHRRSSALSFLCFLALGGCQDSVDIHSAAGQAQLRNIVNVTCHGQVLDGSAILTMNPTFANGSCFYIRGPLQVTDWVAGHEALVYANKIKVDNERRYSADLLPGGIFLGLSPFVYRDIGGHWDTILHLHYLSAMPPGGLPHRAG